MSNGLLGDQDDVGATGQPACRAIQPAWRPITSTTSTRWWDSAVVCSRSIASIAMLTAVSKPNVKSVAPTGRCRSSSGTPTTLHAEVGELGRDPEGVLTADGDQRVDPVLSRFSWIRLDAALDLERVGPRRAQDGAAAGQDPAYLRDAELGDQVLERSPPAVPEPDELVAVLCDALAHDGSDDRVQPGTVAPPVSTPTRIRAPSTFNGYADTTLTVRDEPRGRVAGTGGMSTLGGGSMAWVGFPI